jgi:hypothetical protein
LQQAKEKTMRTGFFVIGIALIIGGVAAWLGEFQYTHDKEVAKIGGLSATFSQDKTVPQWVGGVAVLVGVGLIALGATRKR